MESAMKRIRILLFLLIIEFSLSVTYDLSSGNVHINLLSRSQRNISLEKTKNILLHHLLQVKSLLVDMHHQDVGRMFPLGLLHHLNIISQRNITSGSIQFKNVLRLQCHLATKFLPFKMGANALVPQLHKIHMQIMVPQDIVHMEKADLWQTTFTN